MTAFYLFTYIYKRTLMVRIYYTIFESISHEGEMKESAGKRLPCESGPFYSRRISPTHPTCVTMKEMQTQ